MTSGRLGDGEGFIFLVFLSAARDETLTGLSITIRLP